MTAQSEKIAAVEKAVQDSPGTIGPRIVLIDTNCFIRLYQSPVLPFLGETINGHHLLTLPSLIQEFLSSPRLMNEYAWLARVVKKENLTKAAIQLSEKEQQQVTQEIDAHTDYVNDTVAAYCVEANIRERQLSRRDCELLATAIVLDALIATDEWPLAFVVADLLSEPDDGYKIGVITSVHILHLFECGGQISPAQRRETVQSWLKNDEKLHRDWRAVYQQLFGEKAPTL